MPESQADIDICICTFRRPHVAETIRSISRLILDPGLTIRLIVADNDDAPSARDLVTSAARDHALNLLYLHAPARNISIARNACLDAASAPLVAFIDDDELASPGWLSNLAGALEASGASVVLGPMQALYPGTCAPWLVSGNFHSLQPVWAGGEIKTGYTSNVMFRRLDPALTGRRFRDELGQGGEDTMFFSEVYRAGGRIEFAPEAWVMEAVPASRASMSWLLKRRFRYGQTHALVLLDDQQAGIAVRVKGIASAAMKAALCLLVSFMNCASPARLRHWLLRGTLHCGAVYQLIRPARRLAAYLPRN